MILISAIIYFVHRIFLDQRIKAGVMRLMRKQADFNIHLKVENLLNESNICIICNAQNASIAKANVVQKFPNFRKWIVIWGQTNNKESDDNNLKYLNGVGTTHAEGWAIAYAAIKNSDFYCEYIFTMDDDIEWDVARELYTRFSNFNLHSIKELSATERLILGYLKYYMPLVLVFEWPWGKKFIPNLKNLYQLKDRKNLAMPATGFDNGCIIFHKSIVDMFIPMYLGEGFLPGFAIQHSYLNYVIPFFFKSRAILIGGIEYRNPPQKRHKYEDENHYKEFMNSWTRCTRFGPYIPPENLFWDVSPKSKISVVDFALFADISHEVFINNRLLNRFFSASEMGEMEKIVSYCVPKSLYCSPEGVFILEKCLKLLMS